MTLTPIDLSTYTLEGQTTKVAVNASSVVFTDLINSIGNTWAYKDYGVNYWRSEDFVHEFEIKHEGASGGSVRSIYFWTATNNINNGLDMGHPSVRCAMHDTDLSVKQLYIQTHDGTDAGFETTGTTAGLPVLNTNYYCRLEFIKSEGLYGRWYLSFFSDAERTSVVDILIVDDQALQVNFKYHMVLNTYRDGGVKRVWGTFQNYNIVSEDGVWDPGTKPRTRGTTYMPPNNVANRLRKVA